MLGSHLDLIRIHSQRHPRFRAGTILHFPWSPSLQAILLLFVLLSSLYPSTQEALGSYTLSDSCRVGAVHRGAAITYSKVLES